MLQAGTGTSVAQLNATYMQDYIFLSVGRVGSSTELIKQEVLRVDQGEKQVILIDLLSTVQETMNNGNPDRKVRVQSSRLKPQ